MGHSETGTSASEVVEVMDAASKSYEGASTSPMCEQLMRTPAHSGEAPKRSRLMGVDVARCVALMGMITNHTLDEHGLAANLFDGRAAATFGLLAGVGIALISGGRRPVQGAARTGVRAGLAVRGLLIVAIGLALGYFPSGVSVILAFFGLFFIFAIPLIGLRAPALAVGALVFALLIPVLLHLIGAYLPGPPFDDGPTFTTVVQDPVAVLAALCATGMYAVLAWMAFICAGMAAGRLQLSSRRVAAYLLIGGITLGAVAWGASALLLHPFGGLDRLVASAPKGMSAATVRDWAAHSSGPALLPTWSWWWLAIRAPHSNAPLDILHVTGAALALLGGALLLTRVSILARVLRPLALTGGMTLTLYSAHVVFNATPLYGALNDNEGALLAMQLVAAVAFAVLWRRKFARGPLEAVVAAAVNRARRAVTEYEGRRSPFKVSRAGCRFDSADERGPQSPLGQATPRRVGS